MDARGAPLRLAGKAILGLVLSTVAVSARAQLLSDLETERPISIEDARPLTYRAFSGSADWTYNLRQARLNDHGPGLSFLYGAARGLEVGASLRYVTRPGRNALRGISSGDIVLHALYGITTETGGMPALALRVGLEFPTGLDSKGTDLHLGAAATRSFEAFRLHANFRWIRGGAFAPNERHDNFEGAAGIDLVPGRLTDTLALADVVVATNPVREGSTIVTVEIGARHRIGVQTFLFAGAGSELAGEGDRLKVFDCHVHVQPWEQFKPQALEAMTRGRSDQEKVRRALSSAGELLRLMDEERIDCAVLINYSAPDVMGLTESVNEWVSSFVRGHEDRLVACGSVHPRFTRDPAADTKRLFGDLKIRLLKLHPPHQLFAANAYRDGNHALEKIYATAQELERPIMIHTGTSIFPGARNRYADPMAVDDVAVDFPRLNLVLAHAGRPLFMPTALFLARRHPNVHLDLSGIPPRKLLEYLPRLEEISAKCLWGTDYPSPGVLSMRKNVEDFLDLPISEPAKQRILFDNARRLIP